MSYEWVKYAMPLVGVGLGVYLVPFIESRKAKAVSDRTIACFYSEISDYESETASYVSNYYEAYQILWKTDKGQQVNDRYHELTLAPYIDFLSIDNLVTNSFLDLSSDQRKAVKALKTLAVGINIKSKIIGQAKSEQELIALLGVFRANTEMLASFYYLVSRMHHESDRFKYLDLTNIQVLEKVKDALNVSFEWTDLAKKKHIEIT